MRALVRRLVTHQGGSGPLEYVAITGIALVFTGLIISGISQRRDSIGGTMGAHLDFLVASFEGGGGGTIPDYNLWLDIGTPRVGVPPPIQGDQMQGDQMQGDQMQGDQMQGDQMQGDQMQGDQMTQPPALPGTQVQGDQMQGDQMTQPPALPGTQVQGNTLSARPYLPAVRMAILAGAGMLVSGGLALLATRRQRRTR